MPIEFPCPACRKLLRTPDESAGKKARCPDCRTVCDVPSASLPPPAPHSNPPAEPKPGNYFQDVGATNSSTVKSEWSDNPYATPQTIEPNLPLAAVAKLPLVPTLVTFDQIFSEPWQFFNKQFSAMIMLGAVLLGLNMAQQVIGGVIHFAAVMTNKIPVIVGAYVFSTMLGWVVQVALSAGCIFYVLKLVRSGKTDVTDIFAGLRYAGKILLINAILVFAFLGIFIVFAIPTAIAVGFSQPANQNDPPIAGIICVTVSSLLFLSITTWLGLRVALCNFFVIDRDCGVWDSFSLSWQYMQGNVMATFLAFMAAAFIGIFAVVCTCGVGAIIFMPYIQLMTCILYMRATGQFLNSNGLAQG